MRGLLLGLLIGSPVFANDLVVKYGVGIGNSAKFSKDETFFGSFAARKPFYGLFIQQVEFGGWYDKRDDLGRYGSVYGSYSLGLHLNLGYVYAEALWGAALISKPDSYLGGPFQFNHDFAFGVQDARGVSLGISYKHMSSASIETPNIGRDFLSIRVGLPL